MIAEQDNAACVDRWRERLGDELDTTALVRAFEHAFRVVWERARLTLGDVTLVAIGDRVLHDATEQHPILADVRLDSSGITTEELRRRALGLEMEELERAVRTVLIELLAVLGRLTAGVLTLPLQAALSDVRYEGPTT